jgi:hypothetical protein
MSISAAIEGDDGTMPAAGALIEKTTECGGTTPRILVSLQDFTGNDSGVGYLRPASNSSIANIGALSFHDHLFFAHILRVKSELRHNDGVWQQREHYYPLKVPRAVAPMGTKKTVTSVRDRKRRERDVSCSNADARSAVR